MALTDDEFKTLAHLARLKLDGDAVKKINDNITQILDWVKVLNDVDVEGVDLTTQIDSPSMPRRPDMVNDGNNPESVLKNAPQAMFGMFAVPKVIE